MPETKFWAEMTWKDFEARDMARTIAVLPLAATEQHGPHLPLGTDTFIMEGYLARVVPRVPGELPVLFLPVQNCGLSIEHTDFPGTLSVPAELLIPAWTKICECVHRTGCRKLVLLNSHGGNSAILDIIAHDLRARLGMLVVMASWHRFGAPGGLFSAGELAHGIYAGETEHRRRYILGRTLCAWRKRPILSPGASQWNASSIGSALAAQLALAG